MNKREELRTLIELHRPMLVAISEVKPKNARYEIEDCEITIDGFELFHNLRNTGRGIALYVREELKPSIWGKVKEVYYTGALTL